MSLLTSDATADEMTLPSAGPFRPDNAEIRSGGEIRRAVLTSMLALYPVLAAVAVALVSLTVA